MTDPTKCILKYDDVSAAGELRSHKLRGLKDIPTHVGDGHQDCCLIRGLVNGPRLEGVLNQYRLNNRFVEVTTAQVVSSKDEAMIQGDARLLRDIRSTPISCR